MLWTLLTLSLALTLCLRRALRLRAPREVRLADVIDEPRALFRDLICTASAPARAFYDAPALASLHPAHRLELANGLALEASRLLPPYAEITQRDAVFVAHLGRRRFFEAFEAILLREGGRVRRVAIDGPSGPWYELSPEAALELEGLLRRHRLWELPAVARNDPHEQVWPAWWLARYVRGRHHVLRRVARGDGHALITQAIELLAAAVKTGQRRARARRRRERRERRERDLGACAARGRPGPAAVLRRGRRAASAAACPGST